MNFSCLWHDNYLLFWVVFPYSCKGSPTQRDWDMILNWSYLFLLFRCIFTNSTDIPTKNLHLLVPGGINNPMTTHHWHESPLSINISSNMSSLSPYQLLVISHQHNLLLLPIYTHIINTSRGKIKKGRYIRYWIGDNIHKKLTR